ncbi:hypothetical protein [Saccharopolyspora mangrovi]|uniref:PE domain-containing protein n=1 Tax=Saccharopolyspora mangrovi TaxID=3082379 RepID=A0ABU6ABD2_9PSEU|nr:hypothetical protein [Saccharopolyspora sp. S2-29]MEB3368776.1 hypothetical protein [Saccharopolyspora sp. S2-29]
MTTGMEGLAQGASALAGQSAGLRAAVDNGQLVMDPERAEAVAKVYEDKAKDFVGFYRDAQRLIRNGVYGECFIGRDLERKFNEKVRGPGGSSEAGLLPILRKMEQTLRDMAQAYRDSAREMQNTDDENARNLRKD